MRSVIWVALIYTAGFISALAITAQPRGGKSSLSSLFAPAKVHRLYYDPETKQQIESEIEVDSKGIPNGEWRTYWPSGRLKSKFRVSNGQKGSGTTYADTAPDEAQDTE